MSKQLKYQDDARQAILRGFTAVTEAVGATLGPRGQTVVLSRVVGPALVTKDGVTVAKTISLPDPWENEGAKLIQEVAQKTNAEAGDGTTAATILTHALFKEGIRQITAGADPQAVERGIRQAVEQVVETLKAMATPIEQSDVKQLCAVATIAANGDAELANVIGKAVSHAGVEGNYSLDPSPTMETQLEIADGLQFARGLLSQAFMEDRAHGVTVYDGCNIFVTDRRLIDQKQTEALLQMYVAKGRSVPLLIVAEDFEGVALQIITRNNGPHAMRLCPVRTPGSGPSKKDEIEDIAILTGAKAFMVANGDEPANAKFEDLGSADRVLVTPHRTTIIGGHGAAVRVESRKDELRTRIADPETAEFVRAQLERRLAGISASIAVIKIGAGVNSKLLEKRDRAEDSLNATLGALKEGVVPGGGTALVRCLPALEEKMAQINLDELIGWRIVKKALTAPLHRLATNAGESGDVVVQRVRLDPQTLTLGCQREHTDDGPYPRGYSTGLPVNYGYNAARDRYEDLVKAGVIDPVKVVRLALEHAAELAGLLLTSAALVVDIPEPQPAHPAPQYYPVPGRG